MSANRVRLVLAILTLPVAINASAAYTESPELHRLVAEQKLPPLENRLPVAPLVVSPVEKLGEYGGTWHMVLAGYDSGSMFFRSLAYEHLVRWDPNWKRVVPNVASSWTVNSDATVYRFQLRRGMRWSDGQPYTAKDIVAWVDDVAREADLTPVPPAWLAVGGRLPECTAPDDYTVEFKFASPNVLFLEQIAGMRANELTHYPAHYYQTMHRRHNPEGAAELMRKTGLAWPGAFRTVYSPWTWRDVGVPTIDAWYITNAYAPGAASVLAVRNPYYWKVDTRGQQLPYLDQVNFEVVANGNVALQRALEGGVDYQRNDFASINAAAGPAILAAEQRGTIRTLRVIPSRSNLVAICLNLTHPDPGMRTAFGDKRVRIALSEAINRPLLSQQLYAGEGKPWQLAPRPESPFFNRRLGEQYTEYAPERSKKGLDEAGLLVRGPEAMRLLPDGRPFHFKILVPAPGSPSWTTIMDQLKRDWHAVGVAMDWETVPQQDFFNRIYENKHDGAVIKGTGGYTAILEPEFFVPASFENADQAFYAMPWARWFINPQAYGAEPPPESVQQQMAVFRRVLAEPNREARAALMAQVLDLAADEFYAMGICLEPSRIAIRTPGFRNVPASHFDSWLYPDPGPFNPCQFFHEKSAVAK